MATANPDPDEIQSSGEQWREVMTSLYPEALSQTYRVPPIHFFRVPLRRGVVPGTTQPALLLHTGTTSAPAKKKPRKKKKKTETNQKTENPSRETSSFTNQSCSHELKSGTNQKQEGASPDPALDQSERCGSSREPSASRRESVSSDEESGRPLWNIEAENPNKPDVNIIESDIQDDFSQNHVLINLQKLGESNQEVMFIISQLKFKNYGNKPSYAPAASDLQTVFTMDKDYQRGEFDILIIHRHRGILVGELKSIGLSSGTGTKRTLVLRDNASVAEKLKKAISQLEKSEAVLKHLLQGVFTDVQIRKTIFLPYVKTSQLREVLEMDSELKEKLAGCLGIPDGSDVLQFCCLHEQMSDPESHESVRETLGSLNTWWGSVIPETSQSLFPDDDTYLEVVGRFVGPASTVEVHCNVPPHVEVRTPRQAIPEFGRRLQRLVLTPQQLDLMERPPPQVCLTGPPGTGKTVMLVLMGLRWLQAGHDVYVLCTYPGSLAVSFLMERQLNFTLKALVERGSSASESAGSTLGKVYLKFYDLIYAEGSLERAIEELKSAAKGKASLHLLMDEAKFTTCDLAKPQTRLFQELQKYVDDLNFWTACMGNEDLPPGVVPVTLTVPLRCAPRVQTLMTSAMLTFKINSYSTEDVNYHVGDGPPVEEIEHSGQGHEPSEWPLDCEQCGVEVARKLRALIGESRPEQRLPNSPPPLQYKDIFVLTRARNLRENSEAIQALRGEGIPVKVLEGRPPRDPNQHENWLQEVKDAAVAGADHVIAAHHVIVSGLERPVLVFIPGDSGDYDNNVDEGRRKARDKLYVVSRCTTQYIVVNC